MYVPYITHRYQHGDTLRTGYAIDYLSTTFETNGRNSNIPRVAVIITSKESDDSISMAATYAKEVQNITIFAVGIGEYISVDELDDIASDPSEKYRISASSVHELVNVEHTLLNEICEGNVMSQ